MQDWQDPDTWKQQSVTDGGSVVYRYSDGDRQGQNEAVQNIHYKQTFQDWIQENVGAISGEWSGVSRSNVWVDILHIAPTEERPFWTLITCGVGAEPMIKTPEDYYDRTEFVMYLPADWPLSPEAVGAGLQWGWPVSVLQKMSFDVHDLRTWYGPYHTVNVSDKPIDGTNFTGIFLLPTVFDEALAELDQEVLILQATPFMPDEIDFKLQQGTDETLALMSDHLHVLVDPARKSFVERHNYNKKFRFKKDQAMKPGMFEINILHDPKVLEIFTRSVFEKLGDAQKCYGTYGDMQISIHRMNSHQAYFHIGSQTIDTIIEGTVTLKQPSLVPSFLPMPSPEVLSLAMVAVAGSLNWEQQW